MHVGPRRILDRLGTTGQLVLLVALVVVPLFTASVWIARKQYEAQREALGQTLLGVARALSSAADRELAVGLGIAETLAQSPLIDEKRFADHHALTSKVMAAHPGASAAFFASNGQQIYNTARPFGSKLPNVFQRDAALPPPAPGELPQGGSAYVRRTFETGRPVYSDLFAGQVRGSRLVAVSVPVVRGGEVRYCLSLAFPASVFQPLLERQPRSPGSGAVIFDARGIIIARAVKSEEFVGKPVPPETRQAVANASEAVGDGTNVQGQRFFRAVVRSPVTGWGAGAALSDEAAFGTLADTLRDTAIMAALIVAVGAALAFWMGRTLARRHEAERQSRAKDEFIAALSHELRNPIAAIGLAADLLKRMLPRDRQAREVVDTVTRQVTQLRRLLEDLLDNSRALYGKLGLNLQAVDLHACAAQIARDYVRRPAFPTHIEVQGGPVWVRADPARLSQMVDNLLENAVKYGATNVSIEVLAEPGSGILSMQDDGQGIAPELLPRLFEPFVQGEQSMERAQGGLGLGLALVKRLAALQGGSIQVDSDGRGKGSRFTLRFPTVPAPVTEKATPVPPAIGKRRVLVVEDNEDARESLRQLLSLDGHDVALAADAGEALLKLRSFQPDIAFVDVGLPGMNGYELARELRRQDGGRIVLVALTGYGGAADRRSAFAAGFDLHLTKPVGFKDLQEALASERRSNGT